MKIISRKEWGAQYPAGFGVAPPATELWLHHSVTHSAGVDASFEQDRLTVQSLERIGQQRFGGGISYTFVVCASGRVFEGTGPLRKGSHTKGRNSVARAICLLGDYSTTRPSDLAQVSTAELVVHGHGCGWWTVDQLSGGHRNAPGAQTSCPGDAAYRCIPTINARVSAGAEQEDDMFTDDDRALLVETHHEATKRLPNRRDTGGQTIPGGGEDTVLGYAANADGFGLRAENTLHSLVLAVGEINRKLNELLARQGGTP